MDPLAAFISGAIVALLAVAAISRLRRPSPISAAEPIPAPAPAEVVAPEIVEPVLAPPEIAPLEIAAPEITADMLTALQRLEALSAPLADLGDASTHPREVASDPLFRKAVEILRDEVPIDAVVDCARGFNWMVAAAALAALRERGDGSSVLVQIRTHFDELRPWPLFFALRYFESADAPLTGHLVLRSPGWWADHPFVPAMLAEHLSRCRDLSGMTFLGGLADVTQAEIASVEALLRRIDHPAARGLLDEIDAFRRAAIDRTYLQTFGRFITADASRHLLIEHAAVIDQLAQAEEAILRQPPRSILAVGEPRSGKSSFLALLAARLERHGWSVFEAGGPQLQAGQDYIGQLEERLRRLTIELAAEKRVVWHAPDFLQLAASGTHKAQSASILDQVMPAITGGRLVLISEITPAALARVLLVHPALRSSLELIRLRPLGEAESKALAANVAERLASGFGVHADDDVLDTAGHLARHHLGAGQMPGALLDLLKLAAKTATARGDRRLTRDDVLATMSQMTGMPKEVLDERERVDLTELRAFFSARVIGQVEAVEAVVERIAMLKAGLTDAGKPVGVFLFAGPTGTGKTELAKTLAAFLFGSAERLIRLDMSEFQSADALRKIIGEPGAGDALTDLVRRQPFSVVLLDEFEKAHPNIWDLFLQVFDDGRLTDAMSQTVDFRHCIIILTSNLGSTIKQDSGPGFVPQDGALSVEKVKKAINQSFRPEFINRLDRILIFRALTRDDMRRIVGKELAQVLERRGLRNREWAVEWEASALEFLLDKGFSPAMGARPLKRAIDEHLLAPLAATLVEHRFPEGDQFLFVRSDGRGLQVEFVDPDAPPAAAPGAEPEPPALTLPRMMLQPAGSLEEWRALAAELDRLERQLVGEQWTALVSGFALRMQAPDFWHQPDRQAILSRFEVMDRVKAALASAAGLSKRVERSADASKRYSRELIARLASQLFVVGHGIEDALTDAPVEIVLSVQPVLERGAGAAVTAQWCDRLLRMYRSWAAKRGMRLQELPGSGSRTLMVISGFGASRLLANETGLHVLAYEESDEAGRAVARVIVMPTPSVLPEAAAEQQAMLSAALDKTPAPAAVVRRYQIEPAAMIRDLRQGWRTGRIEIVFDGHFDVMRDVSPG